MNSARSGSLPLHPVASPHDLPPITRGKLRLEDQECLAWVEGIMAQLARTMPPERARAWWMRLHIGLHNKAPAYVLPKGWTPACAEACLLEAYASRGAERVDQEHWHSK